jgi:hypothetical protein
MARYSPITNVTPLASMVTGFPVTAALGDQIRDNLVALNDGWWFRATRTTGFSTAAASASPIGFDTLVTSQTAEDEGSIVLATNLVTVYKTGLWLVGGQYTFGATSVTALVGVAYTDGISGTWAAQSALDTGTGTQTDVCCSGVAEVITGAATFTLYYFTSGSVALAANSRSPFLWGVWMGERP